MRFSILLLGLIVLSVSSGICQSVSDSVTLQLVKKSTQKSIRQAYVQSDSIKRYVKPDSAGKVLLPAQDVVDQLVKVDIVGYRRATRQIKAKELESGSGIKLEVYPNWIFNLTNTFNISQQAFGRYWQAGGTNAITLATRLQFKLDYKRSFVSWQSGLNIQYGLTKQGDNRFIKNQDQVSLDSKFGIEISRNMNATFATDFRTQIHDGFRIMSDGSRGNLLSGFLAPAYLNTGFGVDYQPREGVSIYFAPLNAKITVVKDSMLRPNYLPPQDQDNSLRLETGSYLKVGYKKDFNEAIALSSTLDLFANYVDDRQIDFNTEHTLTCSLTKYIKAIVEVQLLYDEDVQFTILDNEGQPILNNEGEPVKGPRVQFREGVSLGFIYRI